jgi:hypothetical protein
MPLPSAILTLFIIGSPDPPITILIPIPCSTIFSTEYRRRLSNLISQSLQDPSGNTATQVFVSCTDTTQPKRK